MTQAPDIPPDDLPDPEDSTPTGWLTDAEIAQARSRLPMVYVDAIPVRVDESGDVVAVGLLLRVSPEGMLTRALVSGRVMYHERVRDALLRHIEKDLGAVAMPRIPSSPQPFTVAEYFPTPGITAYHDDRQHAVSLAYVVPVAGDCRPQRNALELAWLTPEEACSEDVQLEMRGGQGTLLLQAMAFVGRMP